MIKEILNTYPNNRYIDTPFYIEYVNKTNVNTTLTYDKNSLLLGDTKIDPKTHKVLERIHFIPETFTSKTYINTDDYLENFLRIPSKVDTKKIDKNIKNRRINNRSTYLINKYEEILLNGTISRLLEKIKVLDNKYNNNLNTCYHTIYIPKHNGKTRTLHVPNKELKEIQKKIVKVLKRDLNIKEHNAAYAYIEKRSNVDNGNIHKFSNHIIKTDLINFFTNTSELILRTSLCFSQLFSILELTNIKELDKTLEINTTTAHLSTPYIINRLNMLKKVYILLEEFLKYLLKAVCYNGYLPQGSPSSPYLSNIALKAFDYEVVKQISKNKTISDTTIMYTRFADDMAFSSITPLKKYELISLIRKLLKKEKYNYNYSLNETKTKYIKPSYRCYLTGVKINKKHETTYGHEKKATLKQDLFKLFMAKKNNENVKEMAQVVLGNFAYAHSIEPIHTQLILDTYCKKFKINPTNIYKYFLT